MMEASHDWYNRGELSSEHIQQTAITLKLGAQFKYEGKVHGSVGIWFTPTYDEKAFAMVRNFSYNHPQVAGMCGGDDATVTLLFTALQRGAHQIVITHEFRNTIERREIFSVTVV